MPEIDTAKIQLEASWKGQLLDEFRQPYMQALREFLAAEKQSGRQIFPPGPQIFSALDSTPFSAVKVVILGQDPYHGPGQAHGLCFSVAQGVRQPPSLQNIFKELEADLGITPPRHGCLTRWAEQGGLLLNAVLTVEARKPASHEGRGWERFTDAVVKRINEGRKHTVFLLWGSYAQRKGAIIDTERHLVLKAPHPSPFSANRGFFGCRHFSKANRYLEETGQAPIDWALE